MTRLAKKGLIVTALLLAIFLSVLFRDEPKLQTPLVDMKIESTTPKNATLVDNVPTIKDLLKDNVQKGNYVLQGNIVIPEGVTVRIEAGTVFYANRDARLIVQGTLSAKEVTFQSNQLYAQRKYWYGLVVEKSGQITCENCLLKDATSAVTVTDTGNVKLSGKIQNCVAGITTMGTAKTKIEELFIETGTVGILALNGNLTIENSTFKNLNDGLRVFHPANLAVSNSNFSSISKNSIYYMNEANIMVTATLEQITAMSPTIHDADDQPAYNWMGKEYKTGTIGFKELAKKRE